jgi:hypothetical protein
VTVGGFRAHGTDAFARWTGWAAIAVVPLTALVIILAVWDKIFADTASDESAIGRVEDELAEVVLGQAGVARSRLIGATWPGDRAANVRFVKGGGRFRQVDGPGEGRLATVLEYYQSLLPGRLVVLGEPGAGKTVLAIELQVQLLEQRKENQVLPVPVLVGAAAYDTQQPWEVWLTGHLALRFGISEKVTARLVRDGRVLPLLDGLDEMDSAPGDSGRAAALVAALNSWMRGRERAPMVVTCRGEEYRALHHKVDRAALVEMVPLSADEAAGYLREQFRDADEETRCEPILAELGAAPDGALAAQLATPWRLTLTLAALRDGGDLTGLLPSAPVLSAKAMREYAESVDRQLLASYVPAAVRLYDPDGRRYRLADVERWLIALAGGLAWQASIGMSATDIRLDGWHHFARDGVTRSACYAAEALPAVALVMVGYNISRHAFIALVTLSVMVQVGVAFSRRTRGPRRFTLSRVKTREGLLDIRFGLLIWLVVGLLAGLSMGIVLGPGYGLVAGLVVGLVVGPAAGLGAGLGGSSPQELGPHGVIEADVRCSIAVGLVVGTVAGLAAGIWLGLAAGLAAGLAVGLMAALSETAWLRFYITVVINAAGRRAPLRFDAFLDWAQKAGLLRVSGIAYQFRHHQLQDWLSPKTEGQAAPTEPANS